MSEIPALGAFCYSDSLIIDPLRAEIAVLRAEVKQLTARGDDLRACLDKANWLIDERGKECDSARASLAQAEKERDEARGSLAASWSRMVDDLTGLRTEIAETRTALRPTPQPLNEGPLPVLAALRIAALDHAKSECARTEKERDRREWERNQEADRAVTAESECARLRAEVDLDTQALTAIVAAIDWATAKDSRAVAMAMGRESYRNLFDTYELAKARLVDRAMTTDYKRGFAARVDDMVRPCPACYGTGRSSSTPTAKEK